MTRSIFTSVAFACATLCAAQADAANVSFSGFANGYESVDITLSAPNAPKTIMADAGGFKGSLNGGTSFTSYCVDIYQSIGFNTTYTDYSVMAGSAASFANSHAATDIGRLFSEGHVVNNAETSAAMQIAIWEIAYETSGVYNLATGSAEFTGGSAASSGALALASSWLSSLPAVSTFGVTALASPREQDQVIAAPVPEPTTYAMLLGGLLCMGFVARRRNPRD